MTIIVSGVGRPGRRDAGPADTFALEPSCPRGRLRRIHRLGPDDRSPSVLRKAPRDSWSPAAMGDFGPVTDSESGDSVTLRRLAAEETLAAVARDRHAVPYGLWAKECSASRALPEGVPSVSGSCLRCRASSLRLVDILGPGGSAPQG